MKGNALVIGNSDGIGLALTRKLLGSGWTVTGISRSPTPIEDDACRHVVADAGDPGFSHVLRSLLDQSEPLDLCVYCAGIGEPLDLSDMSGEPAIFEVDLVGMVRTAAEVIPGMVRRGSGHLIGLSSLADEMISAEAPSYHAAKAGFSNYLEGLALAVRGSGVAVTNVRFGFVDTKMAKGDRRPMMMSVDRAVRHLMGCIERRPARHTAPRAMIPLVKLRACMLRMSL
jgi:short-subunit dehydrogenase